MSFRARAIVAVLGSLLASAAAFAGDNITIQGRIVNPAGNPVTGASTQFRVQILSPDAAKCVLYDETRVVDLSNSAGLFSLNIADGSGTRAAPLTYSLEQAISNRVDLTVDGAYCSGPGSSAGTPVAYHPLAQHNRKVVIQFRDPGSMGSSWETIPEMDLNPVPYAIDSRSVGGYASSAFLKVVDGGVPGAPAAMTTAQFTELGRLISGTSENYMSGAATSTNGARLPSYAGNPSAPAAGSIWFDSGSGTVKYSTGSGPPLTVGASSSGSSAVITSVTGGTGISVTGSGALTVSLAASGVGAGDTKGSATMVPRITYDTYGRITAIVEQAIGSTLPSAGADHQVLMSNSGSWGASYIGLSDLRKDAGTPLFPGTCATNRTLNWNSVSGVFECVDLGSIASSQLAAPSGASAGTFRSVSVNAAGQVLSGTNPTDLAGYAISDAVRNGGSVPQIRSGAADPSGAGVDGELYVATTSQKIFRYNLGTTTWETMASAGGAGGTMTGINAGPGISVTGSAATPTVSLSTAGVTAGTFAKVTTDAYGRVTSGSAQVSNADIADVDFSKLTSKPATLLGHGITEQLVTNAGGAASLQAGATGGRPIPGTAGQIYIDTDTNTVYYRGASAWQTVASAAGAGGTLTEVYSGAGVSVTGTGTTRTVSLTDVGTSSTGLVKINTDAKGRVTGGATTLGNAEISDLAFSKLTGKPTDLGGYGITDAVTNPDGTVPTILSGTDLGKPPAAAGNLNFIYIANDTFRIYRQIGGAWQLIGAGTPANFSGSLAGEVSGTQSTTQIDQIGSFLRATIISLFTNVQNATDVKTNGAIVKRDGSGGFAAGAVTADAVVLKGSTSGTATLRAPATVTNYDVQLPPSAPAPGQVLSATSGTALTWTTPLSGSTINVAAPITNASGTIGINTASGSQAGALSSADWTTFNNKLGTALTAASIWVGNASNVATAVTPSGDVAMTNAGAFTVNRIRGTAVSAAPSATGQTLRFDGANYTPSFVAIADLRSKVTGTSAIAATCTSSQTLTWDSVTDYLQCQNISIAAASQISDTVPVSKGGTGVSTTTQNWIFAGPAGANGAPAFRALAAADLPAEAKYWVAATGGINTTAGNVGIGSASPAAKLDIVGSSGSTLKIVDGNQALGKILTSDANGAASWQTPASSVSGTAGRIPVFATATSLGDSTVRFSSNSVGINADVPGWLAAGSLYAPTQIYSSFLAAGSKAQAPMIYGSAAASGTLTLDSTSDTTKGIISIAPSGGNVGIATTAPGSPLHLAGANAADTPAGAITMSRAYSSATATRASAVFHYWDSVSSRDMMVFGVSGAASSTNQPAQITQAKMAIREDGNIGIGTIVPTVSLDISARTDAIRVPAGTAAQQPGQASMPAAANGMIRYNSTNNALEAYVNGAWSNLATVGNNQSFAGNVNVGGTFTSTGAATFNGGATVASGGLNLTNTGITNAGNITGVGNNIAGSSYVVVAAGGTNQTATLKSSGTAQVNLSTGNGTSFAALDSGGTTVNYITAKGAAAGGTPVLGTAGADTDINLILTPKGAGKIGIGASAPTEKLQVLGDVNISTGGNAADAGGALKFGVSIFPAYDPMSLIKGVLTNAAGTELQGGLSFQTRPFGAAGQSLAERMRITNAGYLGIGTTNPAAKLELQANSLGGGNGILVNSNSSTSASPNIEVRGKRSDGNGSPGFAGGLALAGVRTDTSVSANKYLGSVYFGGNHTDGSESNVLYPASISGIAEGGFTNASTMPTGLVFSTGSAGVTLGTVNTGFGTERMRITNAGRVGIGTTAPASILDIVSTSSSDQVKIFAPSSSAFSLETTGAGAYSWAMQTGNNASTLNGALRFIQSGTERLRIDAAGNVGIGTATPRHSLQVGPNMIVEGLGSFPSIGQNTYYSGTNSRWERSGTGFSSLQSFDMASGNYSILTSTGTGAASTNSNLVTRFFINAIGNVGIGTTAPGAALGFGDTHSNFADCSDEPNGYAWNGACRNDVINVYETGEQKYGLGIHGGTLEVYSQAHIQLGQRAIDGTGNFDARMSIIPGGYVGIGTISPSNLLHLEGSAGQRRGLMVSGTATAGTTSTTQLIGNITALDYNPITQSGDMALIYSGTTIDTAKGFVIAPWISNTIPKGIRMDGSGRVGLNVLNPGYALEVAGTTANDSGAWAVRSDARLKKDVAQLNDALDRVLKLRGVSFRWKDEKKNKEMGLQRGFIAQEVEKVIPEWVHKGNDGFLHLEKVGIEAYLVESIKQLYKRWFDRDQEIRREVASLAKDNAELKADNAKKAAEIQDLKARMERIEKALNPSPAGKK